MQLWIVFCGITGMFLSVFTVWAFKQLYRSPLDAAHFLTSLCLVFYLWPAFLWLVGFEWARSYAADKLNVTISEDATFLFLLALAITVAFSAGAYVTPAQYAAQPKLATRSPRFSPLTLFFIGGWLMAVVYAISRSNLPLQAFFMPARKDTAHVYGSFYVACFTFYAPLAVAGVIFQRKQRITWTVALFVGLSILCALATGQRRTLVCILLFVAGLFDGGAELKKFVRARKRTVIGIVGSCVLLIPALWWARNYATQIAVAGSVTAPWERRGFWELLFGSPASGFGTFMAVHEWVKHEGVPWGHSLLFMLCAPIPRTLWAGKPVNTEDLLSEELVLDFSPSVFLINELYLNVGLLCVPAAFAIGCGLARLQRRAVCSGRPLGRLLAATLFAQATILFKNGIAMYVIHCLFLYGLCRLVTWSLVKEEHVEGIPNGLREPAPPWGTKTRGIVRNGSEMT